MLTKRFFKSTLLIIGSVFAFAAVSTTMIQAQEETVTDPLIISLIYTSDSCGTCDSTVAELQAMVKDNSDVMISERNVAEEKYKTEYDYLLSECELKDNVYPIFVSEEGCLTDKAQMKTRVTAMIGEAKTIRDALETPTTDDTDPDETPVDDTDKETLDEPEKPASDFIEQKPRDVSLNIPILLITLMIPIAMYFAGMYLIKRFKL